MPGPRGLETPEAATPGARRSALWALGGAQASALVTLASGLVLARLLQPHETGTYAMAAVLVALANLFRDFGVGTYVVQEPLLTPAKLRAALGVALATAWAMALALWAGSRPFAALMNEPAVAPVLQILALNFVVIPFGSVAYSVLRRDMRFRDRATIETAAIVAQAGVGIVLAARGLGAASLAWASLANVLCTVAGTTLARPRGMPWLPAWRGTRAVLRFGAPASAAMLMRYLSESLPTLLIGRGLGAAELGLFNRAQGFAQLLQGMARGPASNVMLPALGEVRRRDDAAAARHPFEAPYVHATALVAGLALPFALTAAVLAEPLVRLLYGATWLPAVPMVLPLALAALLSVPQWFASDMLLADGRPGTVAALELACLLLLGLLLLWALPHGTTALAWAVCAAAALSTGLRCWRLWRAFGIGWRAHWACWRPALVPGLAVLPALAVGAWLLRQSARQPWLTAAWLCLLCALGLLALRAGRHPLWAELARIARFRGNAPAVTPPAPTPASASGPAGAEDPARTAAPERRSRS